jgi:hypothetical protein
MEAYNELMDNKEGVEEETIMDSPPVKVTDLYAQKGTNHDRVAELRVSTHYIETMTYENSNFLHPRWGSEESCEVRWWITSICSGVESSTRWCFQVKDVWHGSLRQTRYISSTRFTHSYSNNTTSNTVATTLFRPQLQ